MILPLCDLSDKGSPTPPCPSSGLLVHHYIKDLYFPYVFSFTPLKKVAVTTEMVW